MLGFIIVWVYLNQIFDSLLYEKCGKAFFFFCYLGKRAACFVPDDLLWRDLGMMSKMFSLRTNLWGKTFIFRSVVQLITQGQVENKGWVTRTHCYAGEGNSLFWLLSQWCKCSGNHSWILVNASKYFLFQVEAVVLRSMPGGCILFRSGCNLAVSQNHRLSQAGKDL